MKIVFLIIFILSLTVFGGFFARWSFIRCKNYCDEEYKALQNACIAVGTSNAHEHARLYKEVHKKCINTCIDNNRYINNKLRIFKVYDKYIPIDVLN